MVNQIFLTMSIWGKHIEAVQMEYRTFSTFPYSLQLPLEFELLPFYFITTTHSFYFPVFQWLESHWDHACICEQLYPYHPLDLFIRNTIHSPHLSCSIIQLSTSDLQDLNIFISTKPGQAQQSSQNTTDQPLQKFTSLVHIGIFAIFQKSSMSTGNNQPEQIQIYIHNHILCL